MSTGTAMLAPRRPVPSQSASGRWVLVLAVISIAAQLMVRSGVLAAGNFYWDDLILIGRGSTFPLFSNELLLYDHDGHFMPGAFFVAALATKIAPLQWFPPALTIIALQAAASWAVLRLLRKILGDNPVLLLPLIFYLFGPLTLPSFSWWAAALNSLPLQLGLAWVAGDAIELVRTGRRRYVVSGALVTATSLLFFEKSVLVPVFAFVVVASMLGVKETRNRAAALWVACGVILLAWGAVFLCVTKGNLAFHGVRETAELVNHGVTFGLLPALLGGPWEWERWAPSGPWAAPPSTLVVCAVLVSAAALILSLRRRCTVAAAMVLYVGASCAVMVLSRSGPDTADELAQTLRYFADSAVVIAIGAALILRETTPHHTRPRFVRSACTAGAAAFVVSSMVSTFTFTQTWHDDPAADYLAATQQALKHSTTPILDQPISPWVLTPLAYPENSISRIFAELPGRAQFTSSTTVLQYLDETGHLVPAVVSPARSLAQGPKPGCGYRVDDRTRIPLDGALPVWDWTVQLNYFADENSDVQLELDTGDAVVVTLESGLHTVYVRLAGSGSALTVTAKGSGVCIGAGPVGVVMIASL